MANARNNRRSDHAGLDSFLSRRGRAPGQLYKLASAYAFDVVAEPTIDEKKMSARAIISTPARDRVRDVMVPTGVLLDDYRLNPVVLWEHGLGSIDVPIAKCEHSNGELAIEVFDDRIEGTAYHTDRHADSAAIFALLADRIVRAASIRCGEECKTRMQRDTDGGQVVVVEQWPLIEWSWGMVGVNPEAVAKTLSRGRINGYRLTPELCKSLRPYAAQPNKRSILAFTRSLKSMRSEQELAALKQRITELTPEELQSELEMAQQSGDQELVQLIQAGMAASGGEQGSEPPPGANNGAPAGGQPAPGAAKNAQAGYGEDDMLANSPPSARFLSAVHGDLTSMVRKMESYDNTYENPEIKELAKGLLTAIKTGMADMATAFSSLTDGKALNCPDGKCDCEGSEEFEVAGMKSWIQTGAGKPVVVKGLASQLVSLSRKKTLTYADSATLKGIATQIARIAQEGSQARAKSLAADQEAQREASKPVQVSLKDSLAANRQLLEQLGEVCGGNRAAATN